MRIQEKMYLVIELEIVRGSGRRRRDMRRKSQSPEEEG